MARWMMAMMACLMLLAAGCGGGGGESIEPPPEQAEGDPAPEDENDGPPPDDSEPGAETSWSVHTSAPTPLTEIGAAAHDGEIWTVGGFNAGAQVQSLVQIYDPATDQWRTGPSLPVPVHHAALVATDTDLVVVGGYRQAFPFDARDEVWVLDQDDDTWVEGPPLPAPRGAGAGAWDGSRIVFGGGLGPGGVLSDEVWGLEDLDGDWQLIGNLSVARDHLGAASDGAGTTWFLGGRLGNLDANVADVDIVTSAEVRPLGELPTRRGGVAAFFAPAFGACLAGGEEDSDTFTGTFAEVECIDSDGAVLTLPPLGEPRHGLGAAVVDGIAYVVLGGPEPRLAVSGTVEALSVGE